MEDREITMQIIKDKYRASRDNDVRVLDPTIYNTIIIARGSERPIGPVSVETIDGVERVIIQSKLNYE